jgi:hypothetical protein
LNKKRGRLIFETLDVKRVTGFLYLFVLATSALSAGLIVRPDTSPDETANTLNNFAKNHDLYLIGVIIDLVSHMAIVALACALYLTFNPKNRSLALLGTLWRVVEGGILAFNEISNLVLLTIAQDYVVAETTEAIPLLTIGRTIILMEYSGFMIGLTFFALGSLAYSVLFVSSKAVPLPLGYLGVFASILNVSGILLSLVIPSLIIIYTIGFFLIMAFELILGFWLLFSKTRQVT